MKRSVVKRADSVRQGMQTISFKLLFNELTLELLAEAVRAPAAAIAATDDADDNDLAGALSDRFILPTATTGADDAGGDDDNCVGDVCWSVAVE